VEIPRDADFRLSGAVQTDSISATLLRTVTRSSKEYLAVRDIGHGELAWGLDRLVERTPEAVKAGRRYILAAFGRTSTGTAFGFSFGVEIEDVAPTPQSTTTPSDPADLPNIARISCTDAGTELLTPAVRPQADGVHFTVENPAGASAISARTPDTSPPGSGFVAEFSTEAGVGRLTLPLAPSGYLVSCVVSDPDKELRVDPADEQALDVVDVDGVWFPDRLSCPDGSRQDMLGGPVQDLEPPEDSIRRILPGIRDTDVVGPAGYPEATRGRQWQWRVERDGNVVALIRLSENAEWVGIMVNSCDGSGVARRK
jgi:hypothetical protein